MAFKSVLKPEGSVVSGIAVAGTVMAVYGLDIGNVSQAHASDANHPALESSRKKAAYTSFVLVSALSLIAKDVNIAILGYGTIIAMEIHYRHAIMANPMTSMMEAPISTLYQPAQNVIPFPEQGQPYDNSGTYIAG
jgi:hypothetical protein